MSQEQGIPFTRMTVVNNIETDNNSIKNVPSGLGPRLRSTLYAGRYMPSGTT